MLNRFLAAIVLFVAMSSAALADDWVAKKLRGGVFVFQSGEWVQIKRGHVVSDDSAIQTAKGARVMFARGKETIDVRGNTRIRISDKHGAKRTVVAQDFGSITVDVEKRNVQHFEVRAPLLAAVVKGTKFTVTAAKGSASIAVERGRVEARDNKAGMKVDVKPKQKVKLNKTDKPVLTVEGKGKKEPIRSTSNGAVLSVKQIIQKTEKAKPAAPVKFAEVEKIAVQQGKPLTQSDKEYAAAKELKAAKKSGNAKAIAQAAETRAKTVAAPETGETSDNSAQTAQAAKDAKKAADKALKAAKKSGDKAAIAAAAKAAKNAKSAEKAAKNAEKAAKKAADDAAKAAKNAKKEAEKAAKDAKKAADKAAKSSKGGKSDKKAEEAAKKADKLAKDAAKKAQDADKKAKGADKKVKDADKKAKDAEKKADDADKKAKDAEKKAKDDKKAADDAAKKAKDADNKAKEAADKAAKDAAEDAAKKAKDDKKAADDADKKAKEAADKAAKDAARDAEKAAKDAAKDAAKNDKKKK